MSSDKIHEARWYCLNRAGMATLCVDEADARAEAARCDMEWPRSAPHRAVQLVEAAQIEAMEDGGCAECGKTSTPNSMWALYCLGCIESKIVPAHTGAAQPAPTAAPAEIERLKALSVTSIMLDVVPGEDGMGQEVYATSVDQVVAKLTELGQALEDAIAPPPARLHAPLSDADAEIGARWRQDSSLATWFPITAEKLKPLSDEQIAALVRDFYAGRAARDNTPEAIVRAVERAHGIGTAAPAAPKEQA